MPIAVRDSFQQINRQIIAGLDRAAALETGRGFVEFTAGVNSATEALFGRLELGMRPLDYLELFAYAQASMPLMHAPAWQPTFEAGIGARVSF